MVGSQGTLHWDNSDGILHQYCAESKAWETFSLPEGFERNVMFVDEMRHFLSVVRGESEPVCTLEDGKRALQIALAVLESNQSGRQIHFD
jgi:predicted dehydrogenase